MPQDHTIPQYHNNCGKIREKRVLDQLALEAKGKMNMSKRKKIASKKKILKSVFLDFSIFSNPLQCVRKQFSQFFSVSTANSQIAAQ